MYRAYYEMRLFEEKEIEEYMARLYEVQSKDDRTPSAASGYIQGSVLNLKTDDSPSVQTPECAHIPRLSCIVIFSPV